MTKTSIIYLFSAILVLSALLTLMPFMIKSEKSLEQKYFDQGQVEGVEVLSKGKRFPLNFEQQNRVFSILNNVKKIEEVTMENLAPFIKMVIYRFEKEHLELSFYESNGSSNLLLLHCKARGQKKKIYAAQSQGGLKSILTETYEN